jgi:(p)ppGpp synthase/HD superfamily hydrolase
MDLTPNVYWTYINETYFPIDSYKYLEEPQLAYKNARKKIRESIKKIRDERRVKAKHLLNSDIIKAAIHEVASKDSQRIMDKNGGKYALLREIGNGKSEFYNKASSNASPFSTCQSELSSYYECKSDSS